MDLGKLRVGGLESASGPVGHWHVGETVEPLKIEAHVLYGPCHRFSMSTALNGRD